MKIGIISDTHDDIENVQRAIDLFGREEVKLIIHAGDFVFPGIIDEFKNLKNKQPDISIIGVLGNNDGEKLVLLKKFNEMSGILEGEFIDTVIDGFRFGIYHGTNSSLTEATIQSGIYDVFIHGHTHKIREKKIGKTLVLNPGTAHKKIKSTSSVFEEGGIMIFDTGINKYKFYPLP
jgi:uncharacterized protein